MQLKTRTGITIKVTNASPFMSYWCALNDALTALGAKEALLGEAKHYYGAWQHISIDGDARNIVFERSLDLQSQGRGK